jgi:hypothetical protein
MPALSDTTVYFSVTNTLDDVKKDLNEPFSFLDYLKYADINDKGSELLSYEGYLQSWEEYTNTSLTSISVDIRTQFINFLSEINLLFFTNEEKRYFENIDLNNNEQLTIALPFFTSKIKEIAIYFKKKRSSITSNLEYIKKKGTDGGAETFIKDQVLDIFYGDDVAPGINPKGRSPEDIVNSIDISFERVYDTFNDYYDLSPLKQPTFYDTISGDRSDYFTSNTNAISSSFYIDEDQAIIDIINTNGVGLEEIPGLLVNYNQADLSLLQPDQFVNYQNTGDRADLNLNYTKEVPVNYHGTDMYYISTGDGTDYVYEKLFTAKYPHRNLLNINHPSTLAVTGDSFKSERSVGLFFKPSIRGALKMESDFSSYIIPDDFARDTIYVIPDPSKYGSVEGVGGCRRTSPLVFNTTFNRFKNASSSFGRYLPEADSKDQTFHSYNTTEQRLFEPNNVTPLVGIEKLTVPSQIYKEVGDIFGNLFYITNVTDTSNRNLDNFEGVEPVEERYASQFETVPTDSNKETLAGIRHKGKLIEVSNVFNSTIRPIAEEFGNVFSRFSYNAVLREQLESSDYQDLDIFETIFFFKTSNYLVIDSINYSDGQFSAAQFASVVREYNKEIIVDQAVTPISNISNPVRVGNDIFYIKLTSDPSTTSPTNLKFFQFEMFQYNKDTKKDTNLITNNSQNQSYFADNFTFNLDTNIVEITNIAMAYNSKQGKFITTTNFRDLNHTCFIHILVFSLEGDIFTVTDNYVIAPDNFTKTINFYSSNTFINNFNARSITSEPAQDTTYGTLRF